LDCFGSFLNEQAFCAKQNLHIESSTITGTSKSRSK